MLNKIDLTKIISGRLFIEDGEYPILKLCDSKETFTPGGNYLN